MADFTLKQRDTWPPLDAVLSHDTPAVPIDLTGATVRLILKTGAGTVAVDETCDILDAEAGAVRYQWDPADTATVATYQGEFEITFSDGRIATVPNDSFFEVKIVADLA